MNNFISHNKKKIEKILNIIIILLICLVCGLEYIYLFMSDKIFINPELPTMASICLLIYMVIYYYIIAKINGKKITMKQYISFFSMLGCCVFFIIITIGIGIHQVSFIPNSDPIPFEKNQSKFTAESYIGTYQEFSRNQLYVNKDKLRILALQHSKNGYTVYEYEFYDIPNTDKVEVDKKNYLVVPDKNNIFESISSYDSPLIGFHGDMIEIKNEGVMLKKYSSEVLSFDEVVKLYQDGAFTAKAEYIKDLANDTEGIVIIEKHRKD